MMISVSLLTLMVSIALAATMLTPVVLLLLWWRDWKRGQLW